MTYRMSVATLAALIVLAGTATGQPTAATAPSPEKQKMTQLGIDRRLTLIAWEAMNHWTSTGAFSVHVFHKNNELAGYCSVLHAMRPESPAAMVRGCALPSSDSAPPPAARSPH